MDTMVCLTHLDVDVLVKAVHLIKELQEDPLHLPVGCRRNDNEELIDSEAFITVTTRRSGRAVTRTSGLSIETLGGDGVNLIDEDDGGGVFLGQPEDVTHHPRTLTQILLNELRADHADERRCTERSTKSPWFIQIKHQKTSRPETGLTCSVVGHSFGQHGLSTSWRPVHEDPPGRVDADLREGNRKMNNNKARPHRNPFSHRSGVCVLFGFRL